MSAFTLSLLLPSLLLASALPPTANVSPSMTPSLNNFPPICYPPQPYVYLIVPPDCTGAFVVLGNTDQYHKSRNWSLPYNRVWASPTGKCQIRLHPVKFEAEDDFSPSMIAEKAGQVYKRCVTGGDHLGGKVPVGFREVFEVTITNPDDGPPRAIHGDA